MAKYKKSLSYICFILLVLGSIACKSEGRQNTVAGGEKPVTRLVIDDRALAAFTKQKVTAVYCVAMGAS